MNEIEKIVDFIKECDYSSFVKGFILYEKETLFEKNNLTIEQKIEILDIAYSKIMDNKQTSLLGDEHSEIVENVISKYIKNDIKKHSRR